MKERPVVFDAPAVQAILDGRKTQMRRVVRALHVENADCCAFDHERKAWEFGETHQGPVAHVTWAKCPFGQPGDRLWVRETFAWPGEEIMLYRAEPSHIAFAERMSTDKNYPQVHWRSSTQMPRRASRITLEIQDVKANRLPDVSHELAVSEGIFRGDDCFAKSPWVWVVSFKRVQS